MTTSEASLNGATVQHAAAENGVQRTHYAILVDASGLPDTARGLILEAVRHTRLSPGEQACVAEELIGHFADGLEAGVSLDDLVESFGDSRTTGTLIRRAKLRCCPKPWIANAIAQLGLVSMFASCVGVTYFVLIFFTPKLLAMYAHANADLPGFPKVTVQIASFLFRFHLWAVPLVAMLGLFEWQCRGENKGQHRTSLFVGLSFVSILAVLWLCVAHMIGLVLIAPVLER